MTDDDPKYYNAWTKIMATEKKTRHLLCTWHVIKNWNIQGRNKLKNNENRVEMKKEMRKILRETNVEKFTILAEKYFEHLQNENETDFLNYLKRNYFQSQDRIMKWAHCYRVNVGINTNMAIESLNKVLKYNKMQGNRRIRVEKLLDLLDDLVDDKMWKTILNTERPNANNFQHRMTIRAHKAASNSEHLVQATEFGKFQVHSSSQTDKYYTVSYNQLCPEECKSVYCPECKVCIHRYNCECAEFVVKTAMCKHIHMVAQFERKCEFLLASSPAENDDLEEIHLLVEEPSTSKYQEEVSRFLQERCEKEVTTVIEEEICRQIKLDNFVNFAKSLDNEMFEKLMNGTQALMNEIERKQGKIGIKRKIEKQSYFFNKK